MHGPHCIRRKKEGHCNFGVRSYDKYVVTGQSRGSLELMAGGRGHCCGAAEWCHGGDTLNERHKQLLNLPVDA